jgi:signal transduction histidine kinase
MMSDRNNLRVLFIEDLPEDVEIVYQKLMDDMRCPVILDNAVSKEEYLRLLESNTYDVILADYTLPGYNAMAALEAAKALCPKTPFICVSGTIGEELAVDMLIMGATDYVLKDRLNRLSFAIVRALESVKNKCEIKQAEAQAQRSAMQAEEFKKQSELITDYFLNLSHEFKTPISIIMLALEMMDYNLAQDELNRDDIAQNTATIKLNTYRLSRLVGNLLDITKIDAGFMTPCWENINIVQFLCKLVESMERYTAKKGIAISFQSIAETKLIQTDSQMIERILLNLISNAIKHTPRGGNILIRYQEAEDKYMIEVMDNGEGIPDEKKEIIFNRFRQVETSFTRANGGCGIGLALTKALTEIMNGRISLESKPNEGSTFTVELPLHKADERLQAPITREMDMNVRVQIELSDVINA